MTLFSQEDVEDWRGGIICRGSRSWSVRRHCATHDGVTANYPHTLLTLPHLQSGSRLLVPEPRWAGNGGDVECVCSDYIPGPNKIGETPQHRAASASCQHNENNVFPRRVDSQYLQWSLWLPLAFPFDQWKDHIIKGPWSFLVSFSFAGPEGLDDLPEVIQLWEENHTQPHLQLHICFMAHFLSRSLECPFATTEFHS